MTALEALVGDPVVAGWFTDDADVAATLAFEAALAAAQAGCGLIPVAAAAAVATACARFQPDWDALRAGMATDGVLGPAFIGALRATLDKPHRRFLHLGATSQDLADSGLTLRLRSVVAELRSRLAGLIAALGALRASQGEVAPMGHTRMQRALPITAAAKIDSWTQPLERHALRLAELLPRLLVVQFGGPVGTGGGLADPVAASLAARLGLGTAPSWHSGRDRIVEFGGWLALLVGSLGKIGQDVALLAQNEVLAAAARRRCRTSPTRWPPRCWWRWRATPPDRRGRWRRRWCMRTNAPVPRGRWSG